MKGSRLVIIPECVMPLQTGCFHYISRVCFTPSGSSSVSAQGLLGRDSQGHCYGHVYILPHSPFTVPPGTSDFLGLVLSATSFTDYTL